MTTNDGRLGTCPACGQAIRPGDELITYRRSDGSTGVYAECPACERVVDPREA